MLPLRLGAAAAFRCAGAYQVALYVGQPAQDRNHQPPGAGAVSAHGSASSGATAASFHTVCKNFAAKLGC
jgi:hypothetical protein